MSQSLLVFQSLWAMERQQPDGIEWPLEEKLEKIIAAGFEGISAESGNRRQAPHHITQRGNRREDVFIDEGDLARVI